MYYFLLYNSSIINNNYPNQKFIVVLSYGSVLHMITHAITYHTDIEFLKIFRSYFWNIFLLDIVLLAYKIWGSSDTTSNEHLKLSINLLKNKVYNMMDGNHTIKITDDTVAEPPIITSKLSTSTPINKIKQPLGTPIVSPSVEPLDFSNPFDKLDTNTATTNTSTSQSNVQQQPSSFKEFPSNPLVYNPKIDIGSDTQGMTSGPPPPIATKKGQSNEYTAPSDNKRPDGPVPTNVKYGFSTTTDTDFDSILDENKSIASDVASVIDLDGF